MWQYFQIGFFDFQFMVRWSLDISSQPLNLLTSHILAAQPAFEGIGPPVSDLTQLRSDRHQPPTNPTSRQAFEGIRPLVDTSLLHETDFSPQTVLG